MKYEACPAMWQAIYEGQRATDISGDAANMGTACHATFEDLVSRGLHVSLAQLPGSLMDEAKISYDRAYWQLFSDRVRYDEGWKLVQAWLARQNWDNREVLMTETKLNFVLNTSAGPVPFNYIFDRLDRITNPDGTYDIEVVDYKSVMMPVSAPELKERIQSRSYAAAAHKMYPDAKHIWVTFDLLRYRPVGIVFTPTEAEETEAYLLDLAERIIADVDPKEVLNDECRWCVRRDSCKTLANYEVTAGQMVVDHLEAAERRFLLDCKRKAIEAQIDDLDKVVLRYLDDTKEGSFVVSMEDGRTVEAKVGQSRRRFIKVKEVAEVMGADWVVDHASLPVGPIDDVLADASVDEQDKSLLNRAVGWSHGNASVTVKVQKAPKK